MQQNKPQAKAKKKGAATKRSRILYSASVPEVVLKCLAFIGIPYLYVIVCGIIHDALINAGAITVSQRDGLILFVFFSLMAFWLVGLILSLWNIVSFAKKIRRAPKAKGDKAQKSGKEKAAAQKPVKETALTKQSGTTEEGASGAAESNSSKA